MIRCPTCGVESENMDLHEAALHTESNNESNAAGQVNLPADAALPVEDAARSHRAMPATAAPSEKPQSATPRTDAAYAEAYKGRDGEWITLTPDSKAWDFARQLERELAARDEELAQVSDMLQDARDAAQSATGRSAIIQECREAVLMVGQSAHEAASVKDATDYVAGYQDAAVDCDEALRDLDKTTKP